MRVQWFIDIAKDDEIDDLLFWSDIEIIPRKGEGVHIDEILSLDQVEKLYSTKDFKPFDPQLMKVDFVELRKDDIGFFYTIWLQ
jgi:hypothetical protein